MIAAACNNMPTALAVLFGVFLVVVSCVLATLGYFIVKMAQDE